jgi:hypothetical protein
MNSSSSFLQIIGLIAALVVVSPVNATTIDVVGYPSFTPTGNGTGLAKGNSYSVDTTVNLLEFESYLDFTDEQTLNFYVYENTSEFGTYSLLTSTSSSVTGIGAGYYSSGLLDQTLESGKWYILDVSWSGDATYFAVGSSAIGSLSFGAYEHGYATGTHPLGTTISSDVDDVAAYYQRITTASVPSPATLSLLVLGLSIIGLTKARKSIKNRDNREIIGDRPRFLNGRSWPKAEFATRTGQSIFPPAQDSK